MYWLFITNLFFVSTFVYIIYHEKSLIYFVSLYVYQATILALLCMIENDEEPVGSSHNKDYIHSSPQNSLYKFLHAGNKLLNINMEVKNKTDTECNAEAWHSTSIQSLHH